MKDIECPYCGEEQEVCHDDGQGYDEDVLHEMQCCKCDKNFTFTTWISFTYESYKADCLNGAEHKLNPTTAIPVEYTRMQCENCEYSRRATQEEIKELTNSETPKGK